VQRVAIDVTKEGFVPATAEVKAGVPLELVFTRRTEETCAKEIDVPSIRVRKALSLNQPVAIVVPAGPARTLAFACGMNMFKGSVLVR
jgi:plastocyanin domain-containing protein